MSGTGPNGAPGISGNVLVSAIAGMFVAVIAAVVFVSVGLEDSQNPAGLVALLLGSFATLVTTLGTLYQVGKLATRVEQTGNTVERLANGAGDAKLEQAVHRALNQRETNPDDRTTPSR